MERSHCSTENRSPTSASFAAGTPTIKLRNPGPADVGLLVEVADTSLEFDRQVKLRMYAAAGIPEYWIVNLRDRQVETHHDPRAATESSEAVYNSGETISATGKLLLTLDDGRCGEIAVAAILL